MITTCSSVAGGDRKSTRSVLPEPGTRSSSRGWFLNCPTTVDLYLVPRWGTGWTAIIWATETDSRLRGMDSERVGWVPENIDVELPSAARVYDYLLGGGHNFAVDRVVGERVLQALPNGRQIASANRAFLRRAVLYMIEQGITQFLDLGSGIPTVGNVHEVAQEANAMCRVVYVDNDEVAVAHSQMILEGNRNATVVAADLCQSATVLGAPAVKRLLDFNKPLGLLMVAVFHFVPDEKSPLDILSQYRDALPTGSLLALSHLTADQRPVGMSAVVEAMKNSRDPMYFRSYDDVVAMFDGFELIEPGVVDAPQWRPDRDSYETGPLGIYAGLGRKALAVPQSTR